MSDEPEDAPVAREETEAERLARKWGVTLREEPETAWPEVGRWMGDGTMEAIREAVGGDLASLAERLDDVAGWQEGILQRLGALATAISDLDGKLSPALERLLEVEDDADLHGNRLVSHELRLARLEADDAPEPPQTPAERRSGEKLLEVDAFQMTPERRASNADWPEWMHRAWNEEAGDPWSLYPAVIGTGDGPLCLMTHDRGQLDVSWGDWIVRDAQGRLSVSVAPPAAPPAADAALLADLIEHGSGVPGVGDTGTVPAAPALPVEGEVEGLAVFSDQEAEATDALASFEADGLKGRALHDDADKHRRIAALLRTLPSEGGRAAECGDQYQGSVCRLPGGHAGAHADPDTDSEEGRGAVWVDESVVDAREPGAPTVETNAGRLLEEIRAAHQVLDAAGVPPGTLAERVDRAAASVREIDRLAAWMLKHIPHEIGAGNVSEGAVDVALRLLAQRGPEGERLEGVALIAAERRRQVEAEGWTAEHDDGHDDGALAFAAAELAVFALPYIVELQQLSDRYETDMCGSVGKHRGDRVRQLTIAGALLAAEIDRLSRIVPPEGERGKDGPRTEGSAAVQPSAGVLEPEAGEPRRGNPQSVAEGVDAPDGAETGAARAAEGDREYVRQLEDRLARLDTERRALSQMVAPATEALCERCHVTPTMQWAPLCEVCLPQCRKEWYPPAEDVAPAPGSAGPEVVAWRRRLRRDGASWSAWDVFSADPTGHALMRGWEEGVQALGVIGPVSPGDPIAEVECPCCGAALCVEHGEEPGEVVVVGVPVEEGAATMGWVRRWELDRDGGYLPVWFARPDADAIPVRVIRLTAPAAVEAEP